MVSSSVDRGRFVVNLNQRHIKCILRVYLGSDMGRECVMLL